MMNLTPSTSTLWISSTEQHCIGHSREIRGHPTFVSMRSFAENDCCLLNAEQIDTALDVRHVNWDDFHTKVLESIVEHKGKNKTSATRSAGGHVKKCTELKKAISRNNTPEFARKSEHHLPEWRSAVFTFACLFIEELERSANKAIDDLSKKIDTILATAWEPLMIFMQRQFITSSALC